MSAQANQQRAIVNGETAEATNAILALIQGKTVFFRAIEGKLAVKYNAVRQQCDPRLATRQFTMTLVDGGWHVSAVLLASKKGK